MDSMEPLRAAPAPTTSLVFFQLECASHTDSASAVLYFASPSPTLFAGIYYASESPALCNLVKTIYIDVSRFWAAALWYFEGMPKYSSWHRDVMQPEYTPYSRSEWARDRAARRSPKSARPGRPSCRPSHHPYGSSTCYYNSYPTVS